MSQQIDFTVELYSTPNFDVACQRAMENAKDIVNRQETDDTCFTLESIEFKSLTFTVETSRYNAAFTYHFTVCFY